MTSAFGAPRHLSARIDHILDESTAATLAASALGHERAAVARLLQRRHRNEVFVVDGRYVLKVYAEDAEARSKANAMALLVLNDRGLPIPAFLATGTTESGFPWTLETYCDHRPPVIRDASEHATQHFVLGTALRGLHGVSGPTFRSRLGSGEFAEAARYFEDRLNAAREGVSPVALSFPTLAAVCDQLAAFSQSADAGWEDVTPTLVHGSFTGANAIVDLRSQRLSAIFDFEEAHFGDIAEDLAWVAMYGMDSIGARALLKGYARTNAPGQLRRRMRAWSVVHALETLQWADGAGDTAFAQLARDRCVELSIGTSHQGEDLERPRWLRVLQQDHGRSAALLDEGRIESALAVANAVTSQVDEFSSDPERGRGVLYRQAQVDTHVRKIGAESLLRLFGEDPRRQMVVLDALGGDGLLARIVGADPTLARRYFIVTSDVSAGMVEAAAGHGLPALRQSAHALAVRSAALDGVLLAYGTHHIPGELRLEACREARRVLRPTRRLVIHDFDPSSPAARWFSEVVDRYSRTGHQHAHLGRAEIRDLLERAGFDAVECHEMYDPFIAFGSSEEVALDRLGTYLLRMYGLVRLIEDVDPRRARDEVLALAGAIFEAGPNGETLGTRPVAGGFYAECPRYATVGVGSAPSAA